ncbi:LysE family translocator [Polaromonas eurypsychrophila]|uniref:Lysine transporter LysE n=1 Tax=Polaromonas eurypsychrophila TaxID=1614635 RepID=A0A916WIB0_9BURK|nr:LysE family translocator [Polaromonas eurypsychrophila]GGB02602.1 lysine transporter LysE [Polaromonas eurypsychrophila]
MLTAQELIWFALVALALVLTPGPNMIYCISRTLCQGRAAGMVSLGGVALGFVVHLLGASFGLSALLLAAPLAFSALKLAGALYLLWLAWQAVKPGGNIFAPTLAARAAALPGVAMPFETRALPHDPPRKLFLMGFMTNLLNPKVAMFYLSFFPQFLHPERGQVLLQSLSLGAVQITVSLAINTVIIFFAAGLAVFLNRNITWMRVQRYVMGTVLGLLALRLLTEKRTA